MGLYSVSLIPNRGAAMYPATHITIEHEGTTVHLDRFGERNSAAIFRNTSLRLLAFVIMQEGEYFLLVWPCRVAERWMVIGDSDQWLPRIMQVVEAAFRKHLRDHPMP